MNKLLEFTRQKAFIFLALIVLLGLAIRLNKLSEIPVSLYWDEVSIGYNAYSISYNLRDEYGKMMPMLFRAYNDYKFPVYIYIDAIFVKIFGLSALSVRLPSAVFGTLSIIVTFFLTKNLLSKEKIRRIPNPTFFSLLVAFLLSISPWAIQFSRGGFEANLALFFTLLGTLMFFKINKGFIYLVFSLTSYSFAFYTYRGVFLFLPIFILGVFIIWRKELIKFGLLKVLLCVFLFTIVLAPLINDVFLKNDNRISETSLSIVVNEIANKKFEEGKPMDKKLIYAQVFLKNYLKEYSPSFLFLNGDPNGRHSTRGMGMMYLWELPFLIFGVFFGLKNLPTKIKKTIFIWLIAFPIPAALTIPAPHALRSINALPILQFVVALGIYFSYLLLRPKFRKVFVICLSIIIFLSLLNYGYLYKVSNFNLAASEWGDGYKQLYEYLIPQENKYDKIVVSGHYWQPYAYALFYKKYNPAKYQLKGTSKGFGKYYFGGTLWDKNIGRSELDTQNLKVLFSGKKVLFALSPQEYDKQKTNIIKTSQIKNINGKVVFITGVLK